MKKNFFISLSLLFKLISSIACFGFVEVKIEVNQVPKYYTPINDDLYITGSFNNWLPNDARYKLTKTSHNSYDIRLNLSVDTYEYKFTRGSWDTNETQLNGSPLPNRILNVSSSTDGQQITVGILNWQDMIGEHSATGNTFILDRKFPYPQFNRTKRIWIYLPPDYFTSSKYYKVIYMHDGQNIFDKLYAFADGEWEVDETMERFYHEGKETSIVVAIETSGFGTDPNGERLYELTPFKNRTRGGGSGDKYLDFLINNVKPYIDSHYRTKPERESTGIFGSSLGGFMTFYAGLKYQNIFSKVGVFSPSFWFSEEIFEFAKNTVFNYLNDFKIYFVCSAREYPGMESNMLRMVNQLHNQGFNNFEYSVIPYGNHSEKLWKSQFPNAYASLFLNKDSQL